MGTAELISLEEVRASKQWDALRQQLHTCFDQWLDGLKTPLHEPSLTLGQLTAAVWHQRQALTSRLTETMIQHAHRDELQRSQSRCAQCDRLLTARPPVRRTVDTMVGSITVERPYFYCCTCRQGAYPLDEALGVTAGRTQLEVQQAAAQLVAEVPYDEAQTLFRTLTGVGLGSERMHTFTQQATQGLTVLDGLPSRVDIEQRIAQVAAGRHRRPVVVLGVDGAFVATRPDSARTRGAASGGMPKAFVSMSWTESASSTW